MNVDLQTLSNIIETVIAPIMGWIVFELRALNKKQNDQTERLVRLETKVDMKHAARRTTDLD